MRRIFGTSTLLLVFVFATHAADLADSNIREFARDIEQLNGSWISPKTVLGPGVTGPLVLNLVFKKESTVGGATFLNFYSRTGIFLKVGPSCAAELKEKNKKRFIILFETNEGKRADLGEIAYEVKGDKLKLSSPKTIRVEKRGNPLELSGTWERTQADQQ